MFIQYRVAATGMTAFERIMTNLTNNIANAQTPTFKAARVDLETIFPSLIAEAVAEMDEEAFDKTGRPRRIYEWGNGVKISGMSRDMSQGTSELS